MAILNNQMVRTFCLEKLDIRMSWISCDILYRIFLNFAEVMSHYHLDSKPHRNGMINDVPCAKETSVV